MNTHPTNRLPHEGSLPFLTDGGQETTLVFHEGVDLPHFASYVLLESSQGRDWFRDYYGGYLDLAEQFGAGFVLESMTWRANPDWGARLGHDAGALDRINRAAIGLLHEIRDSREHPGLPVLISGCLGPRGDGYETGRKMGADEAASYHFAQVRALRDAGADLVTAMTMTHVGEAQGIAEAASALDIPCVISFTTETDGLLPDGTTLPEAIGQVDDGVGAAPVYYLINCAHPAHFEHIVTPGASWLDRIGGLRANASRRSHAELDQSPDLDPGDPGDLARRYHVLRETMPRLNVLGGCCGTDRRHLQAIAQACIAPAAV